MHPQPTTTPFLTPLTHPPTPTHAHPHLRPPYQKRKRDIIKKVIAYMTLGIDVSRLFTEMMLAIETRDLVIKKMVYLYLCNYAVTNPQLAQMCTNSLQKDCEHDDPMVRGLALRSLTGLRLPEMVEYISEPLRKSLVDSHPYVRKTGVMGILKVSFVPSPKRVVTFFCFF